MQDFARVLVQEVVPIHTADVPGTTYYYPRGGETGLSTVGGSVTTLVDSSASWGTDEHKGKLLTLVTGGATLRGQVRRIKSNIKTALTFWDEKHPLDKRKGPWPSAPDEVDYFIFADDRAGNFAKFDEIVATLSCVAFTGGTLDVTLESSGNNGVNWNAAEITFAQVTGIGSETKYVAIQFPGLWRIKAVRAGEIDLSWGLDWELKKK